MASSYRTTFDRFSLYFLAIFISPILFGVFMGLYSKISSYDSWSFGAVVLVVGIYSFPFYAFGAFPFSLYVDFSARLKNTRNWIKALYFLGCGSLAGLLGSIIIYNLYTLLFMFVLGMVGGIIHFAVITLLKKLIK